MFRHPPFLFGRAQADPHDIRGRRIDRIYNELVLFPRQLAERRTQYAGDGDAGKGSGQCLPQLFGDAFATTVIELPVTMERRNGR